MKLQSKLLIGTTSLVITFVVVSALTLGFLTVNESKSLLTNRIESQLTASRNQIAQQLESYFSIIRRQVESNANNLMYRQAMQDFSLAFSTTFQTHSTPASSSLESYYNNEFASQYRNQNAGESPPLNSMLSGLSPPARYFQTLYIGDNPSPLGSKDNLNRSPNDTDYDNVHAKYHPIIKAFLDQFGFYDIFLVEPDNGHIVYSVYKELDFATSLTSGPYSNTGIAEIYKRVLASGETVLSDFASYLPSYDAAAAFIGTPITRDDGSVSGVLIFQMPIDAMNAITTHKQNWKKTGFGESGETYLVGSDNLMRSDGRFLIDDPSNYFEQLALSGVAKETIDEIRARNTTIGLQPVNTPGTQAALAGDTGFSLFEDYRGVPVFSAYQPLNIQGLNWVLLSEIDESEAMLLAQSLKNQTYSTLSVMLILALLASILVSWLMAKAVTSPLRKMVGTVHDLSSGSGDLRYRLESSGSNELSTLSAGFNYFIEYLDSTFSNLLSAIARLKPISEDVQEINDILTRHAADTQSQSDEVRNSLTLSLETSHTVESELTNIKSATEHAATEVKDGRKAVSDTVTVMRELEGEIDDVSSAVDELKQHAEDIKKVVDVISDIAEQTNLLALNASIEAARAGEMGRGFAVVADEVRNLASKTTRSTSDVTEMVNNIVASTHHLSSAMEKGQTSTRACALSVTETESSLEDIAHAMTAIDAHVAQIDSAINQQVNVLSGVSDNFTVMDDRFESTRRAIDMCAGLSDDINKMEEKLRHIAGNFKVTNAEFSTARRTKMRFDENQ